MATPAKQLVMETEKFEVHRRADVPLKAQSSGATKEDKFALEIEPITRFAFPVKLTDEKQHLTTVGVCIKSFIGSQVHIYSYGIYMDTEKLRHVLKSKFRKVPEKPTKEMYEMAINSDVEMMVRMVFVYSPLAMGTLKKHYDDMVASSVKKLNDGKKNSELAKKILGGSSDKTMLATGSVIDVFRLPGNILQTEVLGEEVGKVQSELLCRALLHMYIGDDPIDKDAKEKFGKSLLSLF